MVFKYDNCKYCKNKMNNNKVELSKLLPTNVCDKICSYNINCNRCNNLLKRENEFFNSRTGGVMTRIEKQLFFISQFECKVFNNFLWGNALKEMKKEIDIIFENPKVKENISNVKYYYKQLNRGLKRTYIYYKTYIETLLIHPT